MVLIKHRSVTSEQVLAKQLWVQVPNISNVVSHDVMFHSELRGSFVAESRAFTDHKVAGTVCEDFVFGPYFLCVGGGGEYFSAVSSCVV